jgi:hypothetical protein
MSMPARIARDTRCVPSSGIRNDVNDRQIENANTGKVTTVYEDNILGEA